MLRASSLTPWSRSISPMVLKVLGLILLAAALLKGYQLLTEPVANRDLWSYRPFLVVQVEGELTLGLWLLSGLFPRPAWLTALACFSFFSLVTFYKGLTGAASCGCFGPVHVNPWITLTTIDLPAVVALGLFRPAAVLMPLWSLLRRQQSLRHVVTELANPLPSLPRFATTMVLGVMVLGVTAPILALNKPADIAATYEVLEPQTWVGKELPILDHIDVERRLRHGTWLVLLFYAGCPECHEAMEKYTEALTLLPPATDLLRCAFVGVPPLDQAPDLPANSPIVVGKLSRMKTWFVKTPVVVLLSNGAVVSVWEEDAPNIETILERRAALGKV